MFLTKGSFEESLRILEAYSKSGGESNYIRTLASEYAKELFEDFVKMSKDEQDSVLVMIMEDMSVNSYYEVH